MQHNAERAPDVSMTDDGKVIIDMDMDEEAAISIGALSTTALAGTELMEGSNTCGSMQRTRGCGTRRTGGGGGACGEASTLCSAPPRRHNAHGLDGREQREARTLRTGAS